MNLKRGDYFEYDAVSDLLHWVTDGEPLTTPHERSLHAEGRQHRKPKVSLRRRPDDDDARALARATLDL